MPGQSNSRPGLLRRVFRRRADSAGLPRVEAVPLPVPCPCGEEHEVPPVVAAVIASARRAAFPGAEVAGREWVVAFADAVKTGDVINIPRSEVAGFALRVLEVRVHEEAEAVTFLAVDVADASVPFSPSLSVHTGVRIAVSAPDSLADLAGGAS
jgi:hypothetical protein